MTNRIVLIIAMESERKHLDQLMPGWEIVPNGVWTTRRNADVVCITCGIGMVAAAAATERAIATFAPEIVLNFGCAGAHSSELWPGDVVIGDRVVHHGRMRFAPDGSIIPLTIGFQVPGETERITDLHTDPALRTLAEGIAAETELSPWPVDGRLVGQTDRTPLVRTGTVSSGDIWLQSHSHIGAANALTGSLCEDMEAAAIAQICALHRVPFLTVKDISNSELQAETTFEGSSSVLHPEELGMRAAAIIAGVISRV